jgi:hypothetical protein
MFLHIIKIYTFRNKMIKLNTSFYLVLNWFRLNNHVLMQQISSLSRTNICFKNMSKNKNSKKEQANATVK